MLKELRDFIKRCDLKPLRTPLKGAAADAAIEVGMKFYRENGKNFYADDRTIRRTLRGLEHIQHMAGAPEEAAAAYRALANWGEAQILSGTASTYAAIFKNIAAQERHIHSEWVAAKEACEFFNI